MKKHNYTTLVLLICITSFLIIFPGCSKKGQTPPEAEIDLQKEFDPFDPSLLPEDVYRVRRGDQLAVRFLYNPELNVDAVRVRDDGFVTFPVIGDVEVVEKSSNDLTTEVSGLYKDWVERSGYGKYMRAGDEIQLRFTYNPHLNQRTVVRPDGMVSLLKLREVRAEGLTFAEFEKNVFNGYSKYIKELEMSLYLLNSRTRKLYTAEGNITVIVTNPQPKEIFIGGEVFKPSVISFRDWMTPLQAINQAGGFKDSANGAGVVYITRDANGDAITAWLNLDDYLKKGVKQNLYLRHGDMLIVPRSGIARVNLAVRQYIRDTLPIRTHFAFTYAVDDDDIYNDGNDQQDDAAQPNTEVQ